MVIYGKPHLNECYLFKKNGFVRRRARFLTPFRIFHFTESARSTPKKSLERTNVCRSPPAREATIHWRKACTLLDLSPFFSPRFKAHLVFFALRCPRVVLFLFLLFFRISRIPIKNMLSALRGVIKWAIQALNRPIQPSVKVRDNCNTNKRNIKGFRKEHYVPFESSIVRKASRRTAA